MTDILLTLLGDLADYIERAQELIAVFAMAGSVAWASLAVAVRKGLVVW